MVGAKVHFHINRRDLLHLGARRLMRVSIVPGAPPQIWAAFL